MLIAGLLLAGLVRGLEEEVGSGGDFTVGNQAARPKVYCWDQGQNQMAQELWKRSWHRQGFSAHIVSQGVEKLSGLLVRSDLIPLEPFTLPELDKPGDLERIDLGVGFGKNDLLYGDDLTGNRIAEGGLKAYGGDLLSIGDSAYEANRLLISILLRNHQLVIVSPQAHADQALLRILRDNLQCHHEADCLEPLWVEAMPAEVPPNSIVILLLADPRQLAWEHRNQPDLENNQLCKRLLGGKLNRVEESVQDLLNAGRLLVALTSNLPDSLQVLEYSLGFLLLNLHGGEQGSKTMVSKMDRPWQREFDRNNKADLTAFEMLHMLFDLELRHFKTLEAEQ